MATRRGGTGRKGATSRTKRSAPVEGALPRDGGPTLADEMQALCEKQGEGTTWDRTPLEGDSVRVRLLLPDGDVFAGVGEGTKAAVMALKAKLGGAK